MRAEHPLTIPCGPRFDTPPLNEFKKAFTASCMSGETAMTCYGQPGVGKSTALLDIVEKLLDSRKAVVYATEIISVAGDFAPLARALQTSDGTGLRLASFSTDQAFIRKAQADCDLLGTPRVWIFIDQARHLSPAQLIGLDGTLSALTRVGLAPFVVLFAGSDILAAPAKYRKRGDSTVIGRFMSRPHRFRGLRRDECQGVLQSIDSTRWPNSGPPYTAHFAPQFWDRGGRLADHAGTFVRAFTGLADKSGQTPDDLPTKYLISAATKVLVALDSPERSDAIEKLIQEAVEHTTYIEDFRLLGHLELDSITAGGYRSLLGKRG